MTDIVAVVSGGMDSVTLAYDLRRLEPEANMHLVSFNYGQRHKKELQFAELAAVKNSAKWSLVDLSSIGILLSQSGSTLVDMSTEVPEGHYEAESMKATVVPNRNAIMIAIATGIAVAEGATMVAVGVHAGDHAVYPDCRPQFIADMNNAMITGNDGFAKPDFSLYAPYVHMSKTDIARRGVVLDVNYRETWSCYKGGELHCGKCGTCTERNEALEEALGTDPTTYAN